MNYFLFLRIYRKITELKDRAERAEQELKDKDAAEQKGLNPQDEKARLKIQVGKQRDDIVLKAKAATAGWDAAASADERLDLDVDKAYRRGKDESHTQHLIDMKGLNESLEVKEIRITEMLVSVSAMERRVRDAEEKERIAQETATIARQETLEAIATFGGGGSGGSGSVSESELDTVRDSLDAAQEEVVLLAEKCDGLASSLLISKQKNSLLEQLVAAAQINIKAAHKKVAEVCVSNGSGAAISELLVVVKAALVKGAAFTKNNRKDDCFDLLVRTCDDALVHLRTQGLRSLLIDGTQQGRAQSMGGQKKERGSVVLKKTLDRLVTDLQQPLIRKAEEDAANDIAQQEVLAGEDAISSGLTGQLAILERQENAMKSATLQEESRRNSGDVDVSGIDGVSGSGVSGSGGTTGEHTGSNTPTPVPVSQSSSLLKRAKEAEAKVEMLKKQMVAMALGMQNTETEQGEGGSGGGGEGVTAGQSTTSSSSSATNNGGGVKKHGAEKGGSETVVKGAVGAVAGTGTGTGTGSVTTINPAELRKLQRRIKELEAQVVAGTGTGTNNLNDKKASVAAVNAEKALQRKLKDLESSSRREKIVLEGRAAKAEATLEVASASLPLITAERDQLRAQVIICFNLS